MEKFSFIFVLVFCLCLMLISFSNGAPSPSSDIVHKVGGTLEDCAKSCIQEKSIKCRYFKFINVSQTCLMSATDHPDISAFIKKHSISGTSSAENPHGDTSSHQHQQHHFPVSQHTSESDVKLKDLLRKIVLLVRNTNGKQSNKLHLLMSKIDSLQGDYRKVQEMVSSFEELSKEMEAASKAKTEELNLLHNDKESREKVLKLLSEKLQSSAAQADRVTSELSNIHDTQRTFGTEIEALRQAENDMYGNVVQINRKTTNLNSNINHMKNADTEIKKEIEYLRRNGRDKDMQLEKLRRDMMTSKSESDSIRPAVKSLEKNQKTLTRALETIAHKVDNMEDYVNNFQKSLDNYGEKLTSRFDDDKELKDRVRNLADVLKDTKENVDKLINPQSSLNMERSQGLLKMKSDINVLSTSIKTLQEDSKSSKLDMTNIVRDLANVQLSSQDMKNQLGIVARASKQLQAEMITIQQAEKEKPSVVEVAQMHKRVLVALKATESKEARLLEKIQQYQQAVADIAKKVKEVEADIAKSRRESKIDEAGSKSKLPSLDSALEDFKVPKKSSIGNQAMFLHQLYKLKDELNMLKSNVYKTTTPISSVVDQILPKLKNVPVEKTMQSNTVGLKNSQFTQMVTTQSSVKTEKVVTHNTTMINENITQPNKENHEKPIKKPENNFSVQGAVKVLKKPETKSIKSTLKQLVEKDNPITKSSKIIVPRKPELLDNAIVPKLDIKPLDPYITNNFKADNELKAPFTNDDLNQAKFKNEIKTLAEKKIKNNRKLLVKKLNHEIASDIGKKDQKRNSKTASLSVRL